MIISKMKRYFLIAFFCLVATAAMARGKAAQFPTRSYSITTTFGTAIAVGGISSAPFTWQIMGHYHPARRWDIGAGTGISLYEKPLLPLYGDVRYQIGRTRRFNAFLEATAGYSFALSGNANGGVFLNPAVGVRCRLPKGLALQLSAGYEWQKLERLKTQTDSYFFKAFEEKLNHHSISIKVGLSF